MKMAKAGAGAIKIQCAILSRSGTCQLDMSPASGFDSYPHFRIEPRESMSSAGTRQNKATANMRDLQEIFFAAEEVSSRVKCPTPTLHCLTNATTYGGRSRLQPFDYDQQSYNCDTGHSFGRNVALIVSATKFPNLTKIRHSDAQQFGCANLVV